MNSLAAAIEICHLMNDWPERVYVKDDERRFVAANKATLRAVSMVDESLLIGQRDEDLFESAHVEAARRSEDLLLRAEGPPGLTENELETWPGDRVNFVRTIRQAIGTGERVGILGITCELSEAEREGFLRHQVTNLSGMPAASQEAAESMDAGYWWKNLSRPKSTTYYSPMFLKFFKPKPSKRSTEQVLEGVHPDDKKRVRSFLRSAVTSRTARRGGMAFRFRHEIPPGAKETAYLWVQGDAFLVSLSGEQVVFVTHRVIPEPDTMTLLSQVLRDDFPAGVFVKDAKERRIRFVNDRMLKILGRSYDEVINKTDEQMGFPLDTCEAFRRGDDAILVSGEPSFMAFPERLAGRYTEESAKHGSFVTIKLPIPAHMFSNMAGHSVPEGDMDSVYVLGISADASKTYDNLLHSVFRVLLTATRDAAAYVKRWDAGKMAFVYVDVNTEFCRICGRATDAIIGHTTREVWEATNPGLLEEMESQDREVWAGGNVGKDRRDTMKPDGSGSERRSTDKLLLRDEAGNPMAIWGTSRKILERDLKVELKHVAIIFCDIRKFSDISQQVDSHANEQNREAQLRIVVELLNAFYVLLIELRDKHACDYVKYLGDGAMAVVGGGPSPKNETRSPAERAADFALELTERFPALTKTWQRRHADILTVIQPVVRLGVGLHYGSVMFGEMRASENDWEYSVFGSNVATAQRLESAAAKDTAGDILISGNMHKELKKTEGWQKRYTITDDIDEYPGKGCSVQAYGLRRAKPPFNKGNVLEASSLVPPPLESETGEGAE